MEFKLFYLGHLKSNDSSSGKHKIRQCFRSQLDHLWKLPPLKLHPEWLKDNSKLIHKVGQTRFAFLVAKKLDMYAELDIDVLIPKGSTSFKDIDNKLKTICDALSLPARAPGNSTPGDGIEPFKCLLEDDHLIYRLNVNTEYLLASETFELSNRQTMWIINVSIKGNRFDETYKDLIV